MSDRQNLCCPDDHYRGVIFIFGFVTWVNGTLIPYLKIACELKSDLQSYLVATAFFIAYTVMAIPSFYVLKLTGYKKGMALGLIVMAVGAILFVPAANARDFNLFLIGLFIIGTGLALFKQRPIRMSRSSAQSRAQRRELASWEFATKLPAFLAGIIFGSIALKDAGVLEERLKTMDLSKRETLLNELAGRVVNAVYDNRRRSGVAGHCYPFFVITEIHDDEIEVDSAAPDSGKTSVFNFPHSFWVLLQIFCTSGLKSLREIRSSAMENRWAFRFLPRVILLRQP